MKILMLSGKGGSGKDEVAKMMEEDLNLRGFHTLTIHFADLVKYYAKQYYEWNGEKDTSGRALLQKIGTTVMRTAFPTYWAEIVAKFLYAAQDDFDFVLIPDWRFINEFETVADYNKNVIRIRVERPNFVNEKMTEEQRNHISECELDNFCFDWIIQNDRGLEELEAAAKIIIDEIR